MGWLVALPMMSQQAISMALRAGVALRLGWRKSWREPYTRCQICSTLNGSSPTMNWRPISSSRLICDFISCTGKSRRRRRRCCR